ncbi:MAG: YjbQ family protein [Thermoprotei archaeon]|nr:MAG: YjbQ family protein [Thermoprotei archaeon]RLF03042.1 MAG: YjbQ family protein [Thermoprotei archaeon]
MKTHVKQLNIRTHKKLQLVDITAEVEEIVRGSDIKNGICLVFAPHATAAIVANEHERGLMEDMLEKISMDYPHNGKWKHNLIDDNAAAHLASAFIGSGRVFPVLDGRLIRGTWQNIFLVELDGPRYSRRVIVEVLGE